MSEEAQLADGQPASTSPTLTLDSQIIIQPQKRISRPCSISSSDSDYADALAEALAEPAPAGPAEHSRTTQWTFLNAAPAFSNGGFPHSPYLPDLTDRKSVV